jgi:valyl-tRNA synthetase
LYDDSLCEQGRNFCNKIWNCFRLIKGWEVVESQKSKVESRQAIDWFDAKLGETEAEVADLFSKYRLSEALMAIYKLYTDEFSGWYLEMIKPAYQQPIDRTTYEATLAFFDRLLKLLHPFMPFITEELWHELYKRKEGESIMYQPLSNSPLKGEGDAILGDIETLKQIIAGVRNVRASKNIPQKEKLTLYFEGADTYEYASLLEKLANVAIANDKSQMSNNKSTFLVGTVEYAIPMDAFINVDEELKKLEADLAHQQGFLKGVMAKLSNERFVANAKPEIVELERKKKADAESRIASIEEAIKALRA